MNHENQNPDESKGFFLLTWLKYALWSLFIFVVDVGEAVFAARKSPQVNRKEKEQFWIQVRQCLMEFHGISQEQAYRMVCEFNKQADQQVIYFHQPFSLANDLAGHDLKLSPEEWETRYLQGIMGKQKKDHPNA